MAYPFLPVNPCCTDVVLNSPCGCSSTVTNSGCNSNDPCSTNLTASSTIVYDGPILPCIVAEPCDTLNVILQKIDEIICNLQTQINYLTNQVNSITTQVISINSDIINIYNTLGECCSATTTSTSTTIPAPCESFSLNNTGSEPVAIIITDCITGEQEAIVLMPGDTNICVETDSPLTVPGSVIVTPNGPCGPTTTTSTSSTTSTTTTAYPCECITIYNGDSSQQVVTYTDCNGVVNELFIIDPLDTVQVCGCCAFATSELVTITVGENCIDGACPAPTTTTTTTVGCNCFDTEITITSEALAITDDGQITVLYQDCFTNPYINTYNRPGVYEIGCVNYVEGITALGMVDGVESSIYVPITIGSPCCNVTTTTTTTADTSCTEVAIDAGTTCPGQEYAVVQYTDCEGNVQTIQVSPGELPIVCMLNSSTPVYLCGDGGFQYGEVCFSTTTTTTTSSCNCVDIIISQDDLDDATGNTLTFFNGTVILWPEKDASCEGQLSGQDPPAYFSVAGTYTYCLKASVIPTIQLTYLKDNNDIYVVQSQVVNLGTPCLVNGECSPTTTTTTTVEPTTTTTTTIEPTTTTTTTPEPTTTTTTTIEPTTTTTTTPEPTTTTTTTSGSMLASATISSTSNVTDACGEALDTACWVSNVGGGPGSESVSASSVIYTDAGGTTTFVGNGEFYHVQIDLSSVSTSCEIDGTGNVISAIALCP